ncbi:FecCD family ABC transporter permease [Lentilactobacillus farraginis]|uniref:Ferrichrome ABC superfamily ATP binding cassette transporter, membrane protein n=2 Tax=Lentilactobacillus farraginis TaxID=390841 RepID=A0A0R1VUN3_9LACO|nr:iron ABC transporter permease [Lentilactobacillus farraginis]KRM09250.1 ferrichrome ABC superfamily ATP binding cassette transporter, membrane protein [Lentilactobacillus farraginis DSM 18382 = JCM 14108]
MNRTKKQTLLVTGLIISLGLAGLLDTLGGVKWLPISEFWQSTSGLTAQVLWEIRVPRTLAAMLVGSLLAVGGLLLQTISHNPLADPSIIGVNAGANLALIIGTLSGIALTVINSFWLAISGALAAFLIIIGLSSSKRGFDPLRLLLGGTVFSGFISSISMALSFVTNTSQQFRVILVGGFSGANYQQVGLLVVAAVIVFGGIGFFRTAFTLLGLDRQTTVGLGISFKYLMTAAIGFIVLAAGSAVAVGGNIGFVGLGIPQMIHFIHPGSFKANVLPVALGGSLFMVLADLIAKTAAGSVELPLSALSAIVGGIGLFILVTFKKKVVSS